jgi:hypothetical protein
MNTIHKLQAENTAQAAEIASLRDSLSGLRTFVLTKGYRDGRDGYIQVSDVDLWCQQARTAANDAYAAAEYNEVGPRIADGWHTGCTHGAGAGVPRVNGYHCRVCGVALPGEWNDTEAKATERMRQHWVAFHKVLVEYSQVR